MVSVDVKHHVYLLSASNSYCQAITITISVSLVSVVVSEGVGWGWGGGWTEWDQ